MHAVVAGARIIDLPSAVPLVPGVDRKSSETLINCECTTPVVRSAVDCVFLFKHEENLLR